MHGHGSARAERVDSDIFWGKSESDCAHSLALCPEKGDHNGGADQAEALGSRVVTDCGGGITAMLSLAEEDVDPRSNWAGRRALRSEVRDGLTPDGILLVVQGEDDLGDVLKPLDWGIRVDIVKRSSIVALGGELIRPEIEKADFFLLESFDVVYT